MIRTMDRSGDFAARLERVKSVQTSDVVSAEVMDFLGAVLAHQAARSSRPDIESLAMLVSAAAFEHMAEGRFPMLSLESLSGRLPIEVATAIEQLGVVAPPSLQEATAQFSTGSGGGMDGAVSSWLKGDGFRSVPSLWVQVAAAPILEAACRSLPPPARELWSQSRCPFCGGSPQVAAIVEESDEFMHGAPRYLICGRCASWWLFARAVCPWCGEHDSSRIGSFRSEMWPWARIDRCEACNSYIKTFDLREPGGVSVIPLVDDAATLLLDLWAQGKGLKRVVPSIAGI